MSATAPQTKRSRKKAEPAAVVKPVVVETPVETVEAFKGFDRDLKCRGFQYEVGQTYRHTGSVVRCAAGGFHACEHPLDVFGYYPLSTSRYASVTLGGAIDRPGPGEDTKIAAAEITIRAEIKLPEMIKAAVAWVLARAKGNTATGYRGHAAATGDSGHAAATGYRGHAAATGDSGHAAATGDSGHAAATGYRGHAAATGDSGHAAATGYRGHAAATGDSGHAAATGDRGHAAATGDSGHAAATGDSGHAAATGYSGHAAATGDSGHAAATGYRGIAVSIGGNGTAKASETGWLVLAHWDWVDERYEPTLVRAAKVGGEEGIKADVAYRLEADGSFVEVLA